MKIPISYALTTGLQRYKPELLEEYVPFSKDLAKVVFFNFNSPHQSKLYDYGQDVLDIIKPYFEKYSYTSIQLGDEKDNKLKTEYSLLGLNYAQRAYLVKNAALVVSIDNILLHLAGIYNTPAIGIYGPTHVGSHGPAYGNITALRNCKYKPTYFTQEFPKTINENKPEDIAQETLIQLGLKEKITQKSIYFGASYPTLVLEFVPNHLIPADLFTGKDLIVRMDYNHNEECLKIIGAQRKISIIADQQINPALIKEIKGNINFFNFKVHKNSDLTYCRALKETGAKVVFFSEESDEDLQLTRVKFFDLSLVEQLKKTPKPEAITFDDAHPLAFRSYKFLLSDGKIFLSKPHMDAGLEVKSFNDNTHLVLNDVDFWKDIELFYVYART